MKLRALPKTIYVRLEKDTDGMYLVAEPDVEGMEDGTRIGVYELKQTKVVKVTRSLK